MKIIRTVFSNRQYSTLLGYTPLTINVYFALIKKLYLLETFC